MVILNTTYWVSDSRREEWLRWIREECIPAMLATGYFVEPQVAKVHAPDDGQGGSSYSVQFRAPDMTVVEAWMSKAGVETASRLAALFGEEVMGFSTVLELVEW